MITLALNGQNYTATTDAAGNWSTTVPASAVGALGEASYTVTANVTDSAGNSNSANHNVQVNTALPGVTINQLRPTILLTPPNRAMRKPSAAR